MPTRSRWFIKGFTGAFLATHWFVMSLAAGDWPQILGPDRNGNATGEALPARLESAKLSPAWNAKLGAGYAGPAVASQRVIVFHREADNEVLEAFDAKTGKPIWRAVSPASYRGGIDADRGPRCVPLVSQDVIFTYGAGGDLVCAALGNGKILWRRELAADYEAADGYFGAGSTPILLGGKLLVNVGGKNAGLVGLDPVTGKTLWQATKEVASYSSPTPATVAGREHAIFVTRLQCVAVDPVTGKTVTLFPFGQTGPTVNAATPLVLGDKLFVTSSYGIGAEFHQLKGDGTTRLWASDEVLSSQYNTPVVVGKYLYGIHGREDSRSPAPALRCLELATGKIQWSQEDFGCAHAIAAGDKILLVGVGGKLTLIAANPNKYEELGSHDLGRGATRALPALSGGKLFVRTNSGSGGELLCIPLAK